MDTERTTALCAHFGDHEGCPGEVMVRYPEVSSNPCEPCQCSCHQTAVHVGETIRDYLNPVRMYR